MDLADGSKDSSAILKMKRRPKSHCERRLKRLLEFEASKLNGAKNKEAAKVAGISRTTAWHWRRKFNSFGISGLQPKKMGRIPCIVAIGFSEFTMDLLQQKRVEIGCRSAIEAVRRTIADPRCPEFDRLKLEPFGTGKKGKRNWLFFWLRIRSVPCIKLTCGKHWRLK